MGGEWLNDLYVKVFKLQKGVYPPPDFSSYGKMGPSHPSGSGS